MNNAETPKRDQQLAHYLQSMQALRSEMDVAMGCIAASRLSPLQESIEKQEALCAELVLLAKTFGVPVSSPARPWPGDVDAALAAEMRKAGALLRQTNLEYAALLKHSGKTLSLLASLCNTHTGHVQEARGSRSKYQTWSCEM